MKPFYVNFEQTPWRARLLLIWVILVGGVAGISGYDRKIEVEV